MNCIRCKTAPAQQPHDICPACKVAVDELVLSHQGLLRIERNLPRLMRAMRRMRERRRT